MKRIYLYVMLMLILASSCGNKSKEAETKIDADLQEETEQSFASDNTQTNTDEYDSSPGEYEDAGDYSYSNNNSNWEKRYFTDEFGEVDTNNPFLEQSWDGLKNNHFDCRLIIRVSDCYGIQFGVLENYGMANLSDITLTGKINDSKFNIPFDDVTNGVVTVNNPNVIIELLQILETEGTLKLSFYRTDSFDAPQNYIFTLYTPTHLLDALPSIGVNLSPVSDDEEPEVIMDMDRFLQKLNE